MSKHQIQVTVNGAAHSAEVEARLLLVHLLRENLSLTGTHIGCDTSHCGACTVLLDGVPVKSCTVLAVQANGRQVMTVEGLEQNGQLHPIQDGFVQEHGLQCGFCTPGMLMTGYALLETVTEGRAGDEDWAALGVAFAAATVTGFAAVRWLLGFIATHRFAPFAWYRIGLGAALLLGLPAGA